MSCRELVGATIALCLGLAAIGGFGGAAWVCKIKATDCLEAVKMASAGALGAAGFGGTLLAQIEGRRRNPEEDEQRH